MFDAHSNCHVEECTLIGRNTRIGVDGQPLSTITTSTIGANCTIGMVVCTVPGSLLVRTDILVGSGVLIENSHIWDDVVIEDGCVIRGVCSVLAP